MKTTKTLLLVLFTSLSIYKGYSQDTKALEASLGGLTAVYKSMGVTDQSLGAYDDATKLFENGDNDGALKKVDEAIKLSQEIYPYSLLKAQILVQNKDYAKALKATEKGIKSIEAFNTNYSTELSQEEKALLKNDYYNFYSQQGVAYMGIDLNGNFKKAIESFEKCIEYDNSNSGTPYAYISYIYSYKYQVTPLPKFKTSSCENYSKAKERLASTPSYEKNIVETYLSNITICN